MQQVNERACPRALQNREERCGVSVITLAFKANPRGHNFVHACEYASANPWAARVREKPFEEIIRFL